MSIRGRDKDPEPDGRFAEIPASLESTIIKDVILASQQEVVPTEWEWELLRKPLLGSEGLGEELFSRFRGHAIGYGYGIEAVRIKVFPTSEMSPTPEEDDMQARVSLQSHEGNAVIFSDQLAGLEIDLLHHERRGVLSFTITDRHEDLEGINGLRKEVPTTAPSVRLMYKDPSDRFIVGSAAIYHEGQQLDYSFVPTSSAQLLLLDIVDTLMRDPTA